TFEKGKTTVLLGANGAGKSTLFLNILGILHPQSGEIRFDGQPCGTSRKEMTALRSRIGLVFQDPDDQIFSADVRQDIAFGPLNLGLSQEETRKRVEQAARQTGVYELLDRPVQALSFGQKKRVAIAGVLAMRPELIILDEPTAGLDPAGVSGIMELLSDIKKEAGTTIAIATHDIDLVPLYCDYAYVLSHGQAICAGTPEEIFAQPALLRAHGLRLPRIAHLMEILEEKDHMDVRRVSTIGGARREIKRLFS
ncbi:MAG TPA: ATP-binding cassette domain-containing protein, partial [Firmicutes bacterium]|nr:ATP-binding cassette domain-containing protein [Bacillota bacterium]